VIDTLKRATLIDAWKAWMEEHINITGKIPLRNVNGNTTWITKKPKQAKLDILFTLGIDVKLNMPIEDLIDKVVKDYNVLFLLKAHE
jgi:hypothetical protein